jgi:subfamily B ATP-binding cassette protein MsbA
MKSIKLLLNYFVPYKWPASKLVIYNVLSAIFALFSYALVGPFLKILFNSVEVTPDPGHFSFNIDYLITFGKYYLSMFIAKNGQTGALLMVVIIVVIASLLKNGFIFLSNNSMAYIRACTVRDIRRKLYFKILNLPLSYFTTARKGDVMTRVSNDVQEVEVSVIASLTMMFRDPISVLLFMVYLFITSYQLTLFALALLPLSIWIISLTSKKLKSSSLTGQQNLGSLLSVVEETLTGLRIVKGFNAEEKMKKKFGETNERYSKVFKRVLRKAYLASPVSEFLGTIVIMVLMYYGSMLALNKTAGMTPDKLISFIVIFSQIIPPAKNIASAWFSIQKGMASIERIDQVLDAEEKIFEKENALPVKEFKESIEFRNVWFSYNEGEPVLKDISFIVKKGQTVAIVGKSGGGKSTIVDLIPRFMDVEKGSILIDGVDIRELKIKDLRYLMGIVSQQPILFNTSFKENIGIGIEEISDAKVENAARIAHAHDFIMETEQGYENSVGEGGNKLSGGQRQRISIARAIMANPPVLILDEATSALDTESERFVQDSIIRLMENRTSIVIAHRLSTIQHADFIIVIDDGRIVETGTHDDLIRLENGVYKKLHSFQSL